MLKPWQKILMDTAEKKGKYSLVSWKLCRDLALEEGIPPREVEIWACRNGICPSRYERSIGTLGLEGQAKLLESSVLLAGCGGLGGLIAELLARAGIGRITLVDGDKFDDNNLNRQLICTEENIGAYKTEATKERIKSINGAVEVRSHSTLISRENATELLHDMDLAIDALDNMSARKALLEACRQKGIPLVHGAIGGFWGQAMLIFPESRAPWELMELEAERGVETETGNPPFTPAFIASIEATEAIKYLAGIEAPLEDMLFCDLKSYDFQRINTST
ncbi:UBA/THIF-type NAD/FAD binding protein [Thermovirga lienii DSM 17291]|jgi:molybdopterin/thiamine biosynthesis adenylyltransferase|uniref:UBA/THIF-type NAD/FAD binding protein n=1 Tax=Thermovirga lienii (strain ATCC BAA-1197 / DSM 17291 / Cas60314) TaxID=580340 RepID=G7V6Y6_THELD|nr:HesA/MoeB/ThiF family protein [Thermovirga lienii]MDN5319500.1 molybdopterin-synthase adenylyltransferase [Thermovirga sp.]AER67175.1 UBA/THIF-type NAD/FAD binding protein [Thermovirga lienii DSM 17291]KUK42727.1 MAG: UBA/THIF-type NAD/FAD binding protein [Thermovirga lienii]MDN5367778.1 molybdopterin-synthase adenylyltransferase [Thermovirga sp.]HCD72151.1 HesA/MoeB/ThiF family protein [Thermovirga lienii]